jgi:hypothetical protein
MSEQKIDLEYIDIERVFCFVQMVKMRLEGFGRVEIIRKTSEYLGGKRYDRPSIRGTSDEIYRDPGSLFRTS